MSHVRSTFVDALLFSSAPAWSAACFAGPAAAALRAARTGRSIRESGGKVLEGSRSSINPGTAAYDPRAAATAFYSQSNIGRLRLLPDSEHWSTPAVSNGACVRPDDVVLNKLAPVRAAYVSPNARRHPIDANAVIVRGLPQAVAAWAAVCLNEPAYEQLLLIATGVLRRVRMSALASLRLPVVPPEMEALSARLRDLIDESLMTTEALYRVHREADAITSGQAVSRHDLSHGVFFACNAISTENILPAATSLRAEQLALAEDQGWVRLSEIATFGERGRLDVLPADARAVRLRDVHDDLLIAAPEPEGIQPRRTLAPRIVPGDVLLSTLATAFRTAYADEGVPGRTHAADGWVAVRFHETPAAWALVLSTRAIRSQVARLAVGSVQQFISPDSLRSLRVPVPPRVVRERWQHAVERHHADRRSLDRRWGVLTAELSAVYEAVHKSCGDQPQAPRRDVA